MRWLIWILVLGALATGLTLLAHLNAGYVLVALPGQRIELSLNFALALLALGFVLGYLLVRLVVTTVELPGRVARFRAARRRESAHGALVDALREFFAGRYARAEKTVNSAVALGEPADLGAVIAAHNKRADLLAKLIIDLRPARVFHLGDGPDMPSLSSYDKGKKSFQGRSYRADVDSWLEFQERMWKPVRRRKKRLPLSHYIEGNHCERIERVVQFQPELEGAVSFGDLELDKYWNEVTRYDGRTPGILVADGIHYSHYFVSGIMGKSIGGERPAHALLTKQYVSCTQGHSHTLDYCVRTAANGPKIMGLSAGSFMDYRCDWAGCSQDLWWSGVIIKRNVEGGCYDPQFVSLEALQREYGK